MPYKLTYSLQDVRALISYKTIYARGADCYREGRVLGISTETDGDGWLTRAEGTVREDGLCHVRATFERRFGIRSTECDCPLCAPTEGTCKHVAALLIAVHAGDKPAPAPASEPVLSDPRNDVEVLLRLTEKCARAPRAEVGRILLTAEVEEADREIALSFRVGDRAFAQIRDIYAFADAMKAGERGSYGRSVSFIHAPGSFRPECRELAVFIASAARENRAFHSRFAPFAVRSDVKHLRLSPRQLDIFYDLYAGQSLPAGEAVTESGSLSFGGEPPCGFTVEGDRILRLSADADFRLFHGAEYTYVLCRDRLYRAEGDFARYAVPVLEHLSAEGSGPLRITGPGAPAFVTSVLPRLESCAYVAGGDLLRSRYPIPEEHLSVRISYDGHAVFCEPQFFYNGLAVPPLRPILPGECRDAVNENRILSLLYGYGFYAVTGQRLALDREDALVAFAGRGLPELRGITEVIEDTGCEKLALVKEEPLTLSLSVENGRLHLSFTGSDFSDEELRRSLEAYRAGKDWLRLADGTVKALHKDSMRLLSELEQNGFSPLSGGADAPLCRAFFLDSLLSSHPELVRSRDSGVLLLEETIKNTNNSAPIPEGVHAELRDYQKKGYRWLSALEQARLGGILADDMGLGKTLQILTLISSADRGCSLVVCPASLLYNWLSEANRFCPSLRVRVAAGTPEERQAAVAAHGELDLLITSYDLLRNDQALYKDITFRLIIADEAQHIKNHRTKNARALKTVSGLSRFALTGTPVENALSDLWSIFDFILPGLLPTYPRFHKNYELPAQKSGVVSPVLQNAVQPFILRRLKTTVLSELPEKTESIVPAVFSPEQQRIYDATLARTREEFRAYLAENGMPDTVRFLALLLRLRQICCHPALCAPGYTGESAKLELCMELLHSAVENGHRVLLFSQFTSMIDLLKARLDADGIPWLVLTGETKNEERLRLVGDFNNGTVPVFLISLKAGGTGLNLTGADVVIHYDPWWNVAAQNQATDRAYRIGQTHKVQVYKLIVKNSVEEQILKLQQHKSGLSDALVREGGISLSSLTGAELRAVLGV